MFKTIFKTVLLFVLIIGNMALISWYINRLGWDKTAGERNLIYNVQADAIPANKDFSYLIHQQKQQKPSSSVQSEEKVDTQQTVLQFKESNIYLDKTVQKKFEELLKTLKLNSSSTILVLVGPASSSGNVLTLEIAKLRAQTVARFIHPYTQSVKMRYMPSLEKDAVVVEFNQTFSKKIQDK